MDDLILLGDNLELLPRFGDGAFAMIYLDPPFNTGQERSARPLRAVADPDGDRTGFGGRRYRTELLEQSSYRDSFDDYLGFLEPRLRHAHRLLSAEGTLYLHLDYREAHYVKLLCDEVFGRECFLNEIVWAYDYGGKPKRRWPAKHDTILVYVRDPDRLLVRLRGGGARAVHGPGARHTREGGPRQAPDRLLVAHHRPHQRAASARAIRRRNPRASCAGWCRPRPGPATAWPTSLPAPARWVRSPWRSTAATS